MLKNIGQGTAQSGAAGGPAYLNSVLASTVFDLDATVAASYPGSGTTWANLASAPADGAAQTAYDFYRGDGATSTTYPTFNGSAGSAAAYWECDGGDYFRLKSGTNTTFLNALHKTTGGTNWWVALTFRSLDAATRGFFNTQTGTSTIGLRLDCSSSEAVGLVQRGSLSTVTGATTSITPGTDYVVIFSYSTGGTLRRWFNTGTNTQESITFNSTSSDAGGVFTIASRLSANGFLANGERLYSFAMGNEYLDNTKAAAIIAHLEARHGRDYTP